MIIIPNNNKKHNSMKSLITTVLAALALTGVPMELSGAPASHRKAGSATAMMMQTGYVKFAVPDCRTRQLLHKFETPQIAAGAMHPDGYMLCIALGAGQGGSPVCSEVLRFNTQSGSFSSIDALPANSPTFLDMTWHEPSGCFLAIAQYSGKPYSSLMKVTVDSNMTVAITKIKDYARLYFGISADDAGRLFFVDRTEGRLWWTDAAGTGIPDAEPLPISMQPLTGVTAKYVSSISLDRDAFTLYYAVTDASGKATLVSYDPVTGDATVKGDIGSNSKEVTGLCVATGNKADVAAPSEFKTVTGAAGAKNASLSWKAAPGAAGYAIYINGNLEAETQGTSYNVNSLSDGYNYIRVASTDAAGNTGGYADAFFWAGIDVPKAVSDVTTERVYPDSARLSWKAPTEGVHGGYLSPSNIKYRITRHAFDGTETVVAKTFRGNDFREQIAEPGTFHYTIQSLSSNYGESYVTDTDYYGKAFTVPYRSTFDKAENVDKWVKRTFPGNKYGWSWNDLLGTMYTVPLSIGNDDWLIAPAVELKEGREYMIYIKASTGAGVAHPKNLKVNVGLSADTAAMTELRSYVVNNTASTDPMQFRFIYKAEKDGEYRFALRDQSPAANTYLSVYEFAVVENNLGHVRGKVTDGTTGKALKDVEISIDGTPLKAVSDENGAYDIQFIEGDGTYTVKATLFGYDPYERTGVAIPDGKTTEYNFALTPVAEMNISGKVTDGAGNPLADARVLMTNYGNLRETATDSEGRYTIKAMKGGTYRMEVYKLRYKPVWSEFTVNNDSTVNLTLAGKILAPQAPAADNGAEATILSWEAPLDILRRDNDKATSQNGNREGNANSLYGTVWRQPATVKSISWQTTSYMGPHFSINVWLLDLTPDGLPSGKVLYCARNVEADDEVWNKHVLETPVECPNGFYMAISQDKGMVSLATTDGKDPEWPFVPGVQYRTLDYTTGKWYCVDGKYINNNYMLRAECSGTGADKADCMYRLWRLAAGEEKNEQTWTLLADSLDDMTYTDTRQGLQEGEYRYALACVYPDGTVSERAFSEVLDTRYSGVTGIEDTSGSARLFDLSGRLVLSADNADTVDMSNIPQGVYILETTCNRKKTSKKIIKK